MTYKSDLGVLSYGIGAGPHAVTSAGGYSYSYDANGNQTSGRGRDMTYDIENHLMKITTPSGEVQFQYDGDGKRIKKVSQTEAAIYVSGSYEIRTTDGVEKIIKHIFTGSDRSITIEKINGQTYTYYCHNDHLGSTNLITDENGFIVQECEYTPYGQVAQNTGTYNSPFKFTGKELDDATELYYYGARYYDPVLCHFIQADPVVPEPLDPQTLNRYSYCYNNPLKYTDPSGNFAFLAFIAIAAAVVSVVATVAAAITHSETWRKIAFVSGIVSTVASLANFGVNLAVASAEQSVSGGILASGLTGGKVVDLGKIVVHLRPPPQIAFYYAYQASKAALLAGATGGASTLIAAASSQYAASAITTISSVYRRHKELIDAGLGIMGSIAGWGISAATMLYGGPAGVALGFVGFNASSASLVLNTGKFFAALQNTSAAGQIPSSPERLLAKALTSDMGSHIQQTGEDVADILELVRGGASNLPGVPSTKFGKVLSMKRSFDAIIKSGKRIIESIFGGR